MKKYSRKYVYDKEGLLLPLKERTFKTNEGYDLEVIDGGSKKNYVTAKIEEYVFEAWVKHIKNGGIKYHFHPSVYGKGYLGIDKYKASENGKITKVYALWGNMLQRAYDENFHKKQPTYKGVEVCKEWYNFQDFASWFYNKSNYQEGWQLDKDLLSIDRKLYSSKTCIFVPQALNSFLTNGKVSNTSGYVGVCWDKQRKKWRARIKDIITGERKHLGLFDAIEEASKVYREARKEQAQIWRDRMRGILSDNVIKGIA